MDYISGEKASAFKLDSEEDILLAIQNITLPDSIKDENDGNFVSAWHKSEYMGTGRVKSPGWLELEQQNTPHLEKLGFQIFPSGKSGVQAKYQKREWEIVHAKCLESNLIPSQHTTPSYVPYVPGYLVYNSLTKKVVAKFHRLSDAIKLVIAVS
jgi:hypothetical protein